MKLESEFCLMGAVVLKNVSEGELPANCRKSLIFEREILLSGVTIEERGTMGRDLVQQ